MASSAVTQTKPRQGKGNRGLGHKGIGQSHNSSPRKGKAKMAPAIEKELSDTAVTTSPSQDDEANICWICAESVKYFAISECNHRTCHVCALRLRALYKKMDCTFCKEPQASVIFTISPDATFSSFMPNSIPYKDTKLSIFFETQEMMEDTLILLRFNCPNSECDYIGSSWGDLKLHVRGTHGKLICDLCIRMKKVFAHEHVIYPPNVLPLHLPSMATRSTKSIHPEKIEGGIHPLCQFCRECFFGDDELYAHMRERHEECFICKRNEVLHQYFQDYNALETHFVRSHYTCKQPSCLAQKFVVFGTTMDLQAHIVEEHAAEMSSRDKRDARRIEADFEFEGRRRERGNNRDRDREPPASASPPQGSSRQLVNVRRRDFGAHLTSENTLTHEAAPIIQVRSPSPLSADVDPIVADRHAAFLSRLRSLAHNPQGAVSSVKLAVRSYRGSESAARDLILTVWNVLDRNLDGTASIVNGIVDILDDEGKKNDLLSAWNGFKVEQRSQFPDLIPTSIGTNYAGITGGRVLNAKHSTAIRPSQSSRQVLDRVAKAASASSQRPPERFPPLHSVSSPAKAPVFRQLHYTTPWSASASATASGSRTPVSTPSPPNGSNSSNKQAAPPTLSKTAFPELPPSSITRAPKGSVAGGRSLRHILGESVPTNSAWQSTGSSGAQAQEIQNDGEEQAPSGKGKKGKGKQKQTLFTLGSFPT